ncbi:CAP domain-containing protein [Powellomyces hirtus]|nr:CAP domain-containing protein [Powellomyces hirtus]
MVKISSLIVLAVATLAAAESAKGAQHKAGRKRICRPKGGHKPTLPIFPTGIAKAVVPKKDLATPTPAPAPVPAPQAPKPAPPARPSPAPPARQPAPKPAPPATPKPAPPAAPKPAPPAAPKPAPAPASGFDADCLAIHNRLRAVEGKKALTYTPALQASAQAWANQLASRSRGGSMDLDHSGSGENLYASSGSPKCSDAVQMWYDEKPLFPPNGRIVTDGNFEEYGHFTQVIWGTTTKLGCAIAKSAAPVRSFVVCHYDPP